MKVKVDWDLKQDDGVVVSLEEAGVQQIVDVPDEIEDEDVSDWLSDNYGWCVNGWYEVEWNKKLINKPLDIAPKS